MDKKMTYTTNYSRQSKIHHYKNKISTTVEKILHRTGIQKRSEVHIASAMPTRQLPRKVT